MEKCGETRYFIIYGCFHTARLSVNGSSLVMINQERHSNLKQPLVIRNNLVLLSSYATVACHLHFDELHSRYVIMTIVDFGLLAL